MDSKKIRKKAKKTIKNYYWSSLIVSFIVLIVVNGGYNYRTFIERPIKDINHVLILDSNLFNYDKIEKTFNSIGEKAKSYHPTKGVLSIFFNQIIGSGYIVLGIINTFLIFISHLALPNVILELIGLLFVLLLFVFVQNLIIVGKNRYYLEHHKYKKIYMDKLFFVYRVRRISNVAYIMLKKFIHNFLWFLTVFGGIYKYYEYFMIPYILAENPTINCKNAFKLSKEMMYKNKLRLLLLQIYIFPWEILGVLTFNLSNIFYFNIYKDSLYAEFYFDIRNKLLKNDEKYKNYFKDTLLDGPSVNDFYPSDKYFIKEPKKNRWMRLDYNTKYSINTLILFFFTCALIGWIWEISLNYIIGGYFVKKGSMYGPWLPIYGYGAVAIIVLLKKLRNNPFILFITSIGLCGIIEYFTGWYLETFHHMKWWDYTDYFLNVKGRICLEGLLIFGIAGVIFVYILAPLLNNIYAKISLKSKKIIATVLVIFYIIDLIFSTLKPNTIAGTTLFKLLFK